MNLVIDIGNTSIKAATFEKSKLVAWYRFENIEYACAALKELATKKVLISASGNGIDALMKLFPDALVFDSKCDIPFKHAYQTPETLGADRKANVIGGLQHFPNGNFLVIDCGTCITYDYVDSDSTYLGGAISPGVEMKFTALHNQTHGLPLVTRSTEFTIPGDSTNSSILHGVISGSTAEINGMITNYIERYGQMNIILTGGDAVLFESSIKETIFAAPYLGLEGLNRILEHHAH